ncbi:hypothetical protein HYALB_00002663 [Hymenoscyphus albidus]|uniref:Major facilitator superfamily (MFS) profile domain-containing protein n=1 Tax=Hymenoscyphus albidus TaxID=595503 RepID=A0A9N9Q9B7_9HELO|nr:hypothetical protein HYALB_00002663 [Hymenoscyphus albidus]
MTLRQALPLDLNALLEVVHLAMPDEPSWPYRYAYSAQFPEDTLKYTRMVFEYFLDPEFEDWCAMVVESEIGGVGMMVGFAVWYFGYGCVDEGTEGKFVRIPHLEVEKRGGRTRRDLHPARNAAVKEAYIEGKTRYLDDVDGDKQLLLQWLGVHPDFRRRGFGTTLCQWGLEKADSDGVVLAVMGGKVGMDLYRTSGFEEPDLITLSPTTRIAHLFSHDTMAKVSSPHNIILPTGQEKEVINMNPMPYTTFISREKKLLTVLLGLATIASPLMATIYFPLLPLLRANFKTSSQAINLTITIYIIFQALSAAIFGPLSDTLGRRPIYLLTLALYVIGNIGLALNKHNYAALLSLRAVQSMEASAAFAVSYGVVADVCVPSERGRMLGPVSMALNLGACVGPVVGGWVAFISGSFEWVFWSLVIVGAVLLVGVACLLPETARSVFGNGHGRRYLNWWDKSLWSLSKCWVDSKKGKCQVETEFGRKNSVAEEGRANIGRRFEMRNPLACLLIIFHYDTFLALWMHSSFYTVDYSMVAATPDIYKSIYRFNEM